MKKVYLITPEDYDYDEYDGLVIIADNEQDVLRICEKHHYFKKRQGEITIKEINLNTEESEVILESFNAG